MAGFADSGARAGTLAAAALETAGGKLQSDMLDWVNGASGNTLAGLLFLLAIAGAVIIFSAGGNYKFARYLLVAPPLFFFLTQVRIASTGAEWQFADRKYDRTEIDKTLEGVAGFNGGQRGGFDVSFFYHTWNLVVTDVVQYLMKNLNLGASDSDVNFLAKVERYMNHWLNANIKSPETKAFVQLALINKCADYYMDQKDLADQNLSALQKAQIQTRVNKEQKIPVFNITKPSTDQENELFAYLLKRGLKADHSYTCDELWKEAVRIIKETEGQKAIEADLLVSLNPQEKDSTALTWFYHMVNKAVSRSSGTITQEEGDAAMRGVNEYVARALFREITYGNRYTAYQNMEGHSGLLQTGLTGGEHGEGSVIATTNNSIQQFNRTEKYQFKGDFLNGALSLPYFQGTLLLLLSVSYPFFAMAILLPGRMGAMMYWMSLWAWVKSWDLGFAVVMMVDNMLYGMFPRGPGLSVNDINSPGTAWIKVLEVDPTYSANTYYTVIATCLYAVPVLTGMMIAKGGGALGGMLNGSWQGYSTGLSTSAANFYRSLQAQTYARNVAIASHNAGRQAMWKSISSPQVQKHMDGWLATFRPEAATKALQGFTGVDKTSKAAEQYVNAQLSAERNSHVMGMRAHIRDQTQRAIYEASTSSYASHMSESAVSTKWYTHDLAQGHPGGNSFAAYIADHYLDREAVQSNMNNSMFQLGVVPGAVGLGANSVMGGPSTER